MIFNSSCLFSNGSIRTRNKEGAPICTRVSAAAKGCAVLLFLVLAAPFAVGIANASAGKRLGEERQTEERRIKEEGQTTLQVYVEFATGKVKEARVTKSSGFPRLDKAAVDYLLNTLRFKAVEGKPDGAWTTYVVTWKLQEE